MISQLIDKAAEKIGGQNQLARRIGIPNGRMSDFKNYEESKRKPPDEVIIALADILGLDKGETLYQAKLELDPKKASYWKFLVRSAGLEPTPQASETYFAIFVLYAIYRKILNSISSGVFKSRQEVICF